MKDKKVSGLITKSLYAHLKINLKGLIGYDKKSHESMQR
jgi:hypothetical protein